MKSVIDIIDLTVEEVDEIIKTAADIIENPDDYREKCKHKKLATLFFEPSTRTRLSFESAMLDLGGNVIGFAEESSTSASKGESMADTARVIGCYADIIAMRSPKEGAPYVASRHAGIPVINAGDGGHCHPTQTLTDLLTIFREKNRLNNLTIGFCGDLKYGRTVHSLITALARYENIKIVLISPDELKLPDYVKYEIIEKSNMQYEETANLEKALPTLDVLYMTRIQRERFSDKAEYERLKDSYILTPEKLALAKPDTSVLHPLPRVNEISVKIDSDPRACYFKQVYNGKFVRMALILKLLEEAKKPEVYNPFEGKTLSVNEFKCDNPKCISRDEQELDHVFKLVDEQKGIYRCIYCEKKAKKV